MRGSGLPANVEAEQAVLGAIILDSDVFSEAANLLSEDNFYEKKHSEIFASLKTMSYQSKSIDLLTLTNHLKDLNKLEVCGGALYLTEIIENTPSSYNISSYVKIVYEKSVLRRLIKECDEIIGKAYKQTFSSFDNFIDEVESKLFEVAEKKHQSSSLDIKTIVKMSMDKITDLFNKKGSITGVSSGLVDLDKITAGFQPGEVILLAARPSMGKTALALNIATSAAIRGYKVAMFSLEMSSQLLMMRILSQMSKINLSNIKIGKLQKGDWEKLIEAAGNISKCSFFIDDSNSLSPYDVKAKCRRFKSKQGLDIVIIDYLQIMDLKQKVESRERAVSEMSRLLKAIARELNIPIIVLAQLNRGVESRADRRPMLSDLRESGSLEQDADLILMLYREAYYDRDNLEKKNLAELIITKHRNGPTGSVKLYWDPVSTMFSNLSINKYDENVPFVPNKPSNKPKALEDLS